MCICVYEYMCTYIHIYIYIYKVPLAMFSKKKTRFPARGPMASAQPPRSAKLPRADRWASSECRASATRSWGEATLG